ncbi:MAG TPA: hypothetical protein VMI75_20475 [Polyangiaceae bacterium]|nr:hypothetical protein [Polyangiaceae bacterium]
MNHNGHNGHSKAREDLTRQANLVRSKLLRTVEVLDQRRHDALDLKLQLQRHVRQVVVAAGIALVATAVVVAFAVHRISTAPGRRRRNRRILALQMWRRPDLVMRSSRRTGRPFAVELLRSVLLGVGTSLVLLPARRSIKVLLEGRVREELTKEAPAR